MADNQSLRGGRALPTVARRELSPYQAPITGAVDSVADIEGNSDFVRGLRSSMLSAGAASRNTEGLEAEAANDIATATAAYADADVISQQAARTAPRVQSLRDIHGAGDAVDFAAGGLGQVGSSLAPVVGAAVAARFAGVAGANRLAQMGMRSPAIAARLPQAAGYAGAAVPSYNMEREEAIGQLAQDKQARARHTPQELIDAGNAKGVVNMALDTALPGHVVNKVFGGAVRGSATKAALRAVGGEAATEAVQQIVGDATTSYMKTGGVEIDPWSVADAAALGGLGGGALAMPSAAATGVANLAGRGADAGTSVYQQGKEFFQSPETAAKAQAALDATKGITAEGVGIKAGEALSATKDTLDNMSDYLKNRTVAGTHSELDSLTAKTNPPKGTTDLLGWQQQDDARRNTNAVSLAQKYLADPTTPNALRAASEKMTQDTSPTAWIEFGGMAREHEIRAKWGSNADAVVTSFSDLGISIGKAASDVKAGFESTRQNAQSLPGLATDAMDANGSVAIDPFDRLVTDLLVKHARLDAAQMDEGSMMKLNDQLPAIKQYIAAGYANKQGEISVPEGLEKIYKDPAAMLQEVQTLMHREGLVAEAKQNAKVAATLKYRAETKADALDIIKGTIKPSTEAAYNITARQYPEILERVRRMVTSGNYDEQALRTLFGDNAQHVIETVRKGVADQKYETQKAERVVATSDEHTGDNAEGADTSGELGMMTNALDPNTEAAKVEYHNYNPVSEAAYKFSAATGTALKKYAANPLDPDALQMVNYLSRTDKTGHVAHARAKIDRADGEGSASIRPMGAVDAIREQYADDPAGYMAAAESLQARHDGMKLDDINKEHFVLRSEAVDQKRDPIDIPGEDFRSVTPQSKADKDAKKKSGNIWAIETGKNNEFGTTAHGAVWLERVDTQGDVKSFATSVDKIVARARIAKKDGAVLGSENALQDQHDMLQTGLASLMNSKNREGRHVLSGRVGFINKAGEGITWQGEAHIRDTESADFKKYGDVRPRAERMATELKAGEFTREVSAARATTPTGGFDVPGSLRLPSGETVKDARALTDAAQRAKKQKNKQRDEDTKKELPLPKKASEKFDYSELPYMTLEELRTTYAETQAQIAKAKNNPDIVAALRGRLTKIEAEADSQDRISEEATSTEKFMAAEAGVSEGDEMSAQAVAAQENKIRYTSEDAPLEQLHPRPSRGTLVAQQAKIEASLPAAKHVDLAKTLIEKGIPAISAELKTYTAKQQAALLSVLGDMLAARTKENPIWRGDPPKDMDTFAKRARFAAARLNDSKLSFVLVPDRTPATAKAVMTEEEARGSRAINKHNEQNSREELGATPMTAEQKTKIIADIQRRVGPQVKIDFAKIFGLSSDGIEREVSGDWTEGMIRISLSAMNPEQIGAHESMHEFFSRITKSTNKEVGKIRSLLLNAASSPAVLSKLNVLLDDHPHALAQIKEGAENYQEERLAYAFQFWQAGLLSIGPETTTVFQKIAKFLRSVSGLLTDDMKAEKLMEAFDKGDMLTEDAATEVMAKNVEYRERQLEAGRKVLAPIFKTTSKLLFPAQDVLLESGNPALVKIAKLFKQPTGEQVDETEFEAKQRQSAHYMNGYKALVAGASKEEIELAARYLHAGKPPHNVEALRIYNGVQGMFSDLHTYINDAGVKRWQLREVVGEDGIKGDWVTMGKIKENFMPHAYDMGEITAHSEEFVADLLRVHAKELNAIAAEANREVDAAATVPDDYASGVEQAMRNNKAITKKITPDDIATAIMNRILNSNGQVDLGENENAVGFQPYMRSINRRVLTWLDTDALGKYMSKDLNDIVPSYIMQATKRAEYVRRFDNGGSKLKAMMDSALEFEVEKAMAADDKLTKAEATIEGLKALEQPAKAVMALEGTIGYDVDPRLRAVNGNVLAYENIRLLSTAIFSQMIDPLGIIVRGGEMKHAWAAYSRGIKEIIAAYKGTTITDLPTQLAEYIGTVEAAGFLATFGQQSNSMYLSKTVRKANEALFRYNGMDGFNRAARIEATQAAIGFIKYHAGLPTKSSQAYLDELNLTPELLKLDADGNLNYADGQVRAAINRWVNGAILRPNAAHRPIWMSDPHYMLFGHMKQFSFTFHDVILKRVIHDAKVHGNLGPMAVVLGAFAPTMIAADLMKSLLITGSSPAWSHDFASMVGHGVERAGLLGKYQFVYDATAGTHGLMSIAGPAAEQVANVFTDPLGQSFKNALPGANVLHMVAPAARGVVAEQV